jgi:16S rRNA (uracil1498-N3)-methyltransferase
VLEERTPANAPSLRHSIRFPVHRFHVPPELSAGGEFNLPPAEARHAAQVLRLRADEVVVVLDGAGGEMRCAVTEAGRKQVRLRVLERRSVPRLPWRLTLVQAVLKGKAMDLIIQKAVELGVSEIVPVLTERSVPHLDDARADARQEKWQAIAVEAIKQCGSAWLPKVGAPHSLADLLAAGKVTKVALLCSLAPGARQPRAVFADFRQRHGHNPANASLWVGPEGDFTPGELAAIQTAGAIPITLGPLTLRAETAAIAGLAIIANELG